MKSSTITIINDKEGKNLEAFKSATELLSMSFTIVSPKEEGFLDVSVKFNEDNSLFLLGCHYQFLKLK